VNLQKWFLKRGRKESGSGPNRFGGEEVLLGADPSHGLLVQVLQMTFGRARVKWGLSVPRSRVGVCEYLLAQRRCRLAMEIWQRGDVQCEIWVLKKFKKIKKKMKCRQT